jgi:uncharacterized repeat protein (TIGR03803 family)
MNNDPSGKSRLKSLLSIAAFLGAGSALGAPLTTLHSFAGYGGDIPAAALVQGTDGYFYGTTEGGGRSGVGAIFNITSGGSFTPVYPFTGGSDGSAPEASLVQGADGNFYGTTFGGNGTPGLTGYYGTVFKVTSGGSLTTLYPFTGASDGKNPGAALVQGTDGNFYGTTEFGGIVGSNHGLGAGTVFQITPSGSLTTLYSFTGGSDGSGPYAGLVQGADGNFYGATAGGGNGSVGTVFQITSSGSLTTLHSFTYAVDGASPVASLIQGADGNFYGTTGDGGIGGQGQGTVFQITTSGSLTTLYSFTGGKDGGKPKSGVIQGADGNFYGTTYIGGSYGAGTVFRITTSGSLSTLYSFTDDAANDGDGAYPVGLVQGTDGKFYGTTAGGGDGGGVGTVFLLNPPPAYALNTAVVTGTSVDFSATVNPNGYAGPSTNKTNNLVSWQYGFVPGSYTASTTGLPIGDGTSSVPVTYDKAKSGLQPKIYHYRLVISSTFGYTYSPDQTFSLEPATVAFSAPATTGTDGALSLAVNPNGNDTTVTIAYGLTTACTSGTTPGQDVGSGNAPVTVNTDLTGLSPNTAYYYRVITTSVLGTTLGAVQSFSTSPLYGTALIVLTKDAAPGIAGAIFGAFGNPAINDSDHAAFQATVTGSGINTSGSAADNSGIWADIGTNGRTLIVQTGSSAPGYTVGTTAGIFAALSDPVYSNSDTVAFLGTLEATGTVSASNKTGIWATASGSAAGPVLLVARAGDPAPDANGATSPSGPVFASFAQFVLPDQAGVAFLANLVSGTPAAPAPGGVISANNAGIWAVDTSGVLKRIIRKGDSLTYKGVVKTVSGLTIFNAPAASTGQTRHFNNPGDLIYKATFTDGSSGIVQSVFP